MFRFSLSPIRGILVIGILFALLLIHLPTTVQARNPYDMSIATEGDPGDGVLGQSGPDDLSAEDGESDVSGQTAVRSAPMRFYLMPQLFYLGPSAPVLLYLPASWSYFGARPDAGAPSAVRGW